MDYVLLIIFLGLHYIRPQEWSSISALRPVQLLAALAVMTLFMREKAVRLKDFFRTPQDILVSSYFAWTVFASPTPRSTFREILPLVLFYFLGTLALFSVERIKKFLWWWGMFVVAVAGLAVISKYGFDPFNSLRITEGSMKGRLVLNLSIFNNPNSLGHGVVPAIPLLYYTLYWKRLVSKPMLVILAIPLICIYMTLSKGAMISAAITMFATLTFGRPRPVQIGMIIGAVMFGTTAIYALPRMNELNSSKRDEAIQGRVAAFKFGMETLKTKFYGHGLGNFQPMFYKYGPTEKVKIVSSYHGKSVVRYVQRHYMKAPHSAYNQNGADLGYIGLFLFVGILFSSFRTLIQAKTANNDEEMCRRALFGLVCAYTVSSWMVDFCYRPTFFLFTAATSALHRHLRSSEDKDEEEDEVSPVLNQRIRPYTPDPIVPPTTGPALGAATATAALPGTARAAVVEEEYEEDDDDEEAAKARVGSVPWPKLGLVDLVMIYGCTELVLMGWRYAIREM